MFDRTPINSFGYIDPFANDLFDAYLTRINERNGSKSIIVCNHYPTKFVSPLSFEELLEKHHVLARYSGHAHSQDYYINDAGLLLDLELADVKLKEIYRLTAFDNGLLSFNDTNRNQTMLSFVT